MNEQPTIRADALPMAVLAYVGDAVFELFVREMLAVSGSYHTARALHRRATALVCAPAQARMAQALKDDLTQEEKDILRRGRNIHGGHVPAGAGVAEYRLATGFESLVGFLHLSGRTDRLRTLLARAVQAVMEGEDEG